MRKKKTMQFNNTLPPLLPCYPDPSGGYLCLFGNFGYQPLLGWPSVPSSPRVLQSACSPKPLQIPGFPSILLALENKRTVSSISTTCLVPLDQRTMSGLRLVWVIFSGNLCMLLTLSPPLMEFSVIYEKTHCSAQLFVEMLLFSWILPTFKNAILTYCMFSYLYNKIFWPLNIIHWTQL